MKIYPYSPTIRRKEMDSVLTAMVQEQVGPGHLSGKLIQAAKEYLGFDYAVALRSPATALHLALQALDLSQGRSVLISALSPWYYKAVLDDLRVVPVYVDVSEGYCVPDPEAFQKALSPDVGAIILNHTLGYVPDVPAICSFGVPVIEDLSRSFGANWLDRKVGTFGVLSILGMEERDVLTSGGGALLIANARREGSVLRKYSTLPNEYLLPDLNSALGLVQFKEAERNYQRRKEIASVYAQTLVQTRHRRPIQPGDADYNNYSFPVILESGVKEVFSYATKKDVQLELAFADTIVARQEGMSVQCPNAVSLALRTALFPLYPRLGTDQVARVAKVLATLP